MKTRWEAPIMARSTVKILQKRLELQEAKVAAMETELREMSRYLPDYWRRNHNKRPEYVYPIVIQPLNENREGHWVDPR